MMGGCGLESDGQGEAPGTDAGMVDVVTRDASQDADGNATVEFTSVGASLSAGAGVSTSPHFKAVVTLGESPGDPTSASSPHFKLFGGVVSAPQTH
jgi:hypothetical protein